MWRLRGKYGSRDVACLTGRPGLSSARPSVLSTLQAAWRAKLLSAPVQHAAAGRTSVVEPTEVAAKAGAPPPSSGSRCWRRPDVESGCWRGLGRGSADEATTTGQIVSVYVLLDRTGARMHSQPFCISDILGTSQTTWGRRPLVCLGSRGDQYWALFWSRWWCPSPSLPVFPHGVVCPGHLAERWPTWPRIPKPVGRPMGDEMSRRSHLPSGCEATTCRVRISRGGE